MLNRSRLLLAAGFVTAVAAGTFLSPTSVCATTGGCLFPTLAVSQYQNTIGNDIQNNLSSNVGRCREQCDEAFNGCTGVANAAEDCVLESIEADAGAQVRGCNDLSSPSSGVSKQSTRDGLREFSNSVKNDKKSAIANCENLKANCHSLCGQSKKD